MVASLCCVVLGSIYGTVIAIAGIERNWSTVKQLGLLLGGTILGGSLVYSLFQWLS